MEKSYGWADSFGCIGIRPIPTEKGRNDVLSKRFTMFFLMTPLITYAVIAFTTVLFFYYGVFRPLCSLLRFFVSLFYYAVMLAVRSDGRYRAKRFIVRGQRDAESGGQFCRDRFGLICENCFPCDILLAL
uniref:Uncharacterized protein n=1 Tax=Globodera rostochiensis TaxID=31243 RepID=A0A914HYB6_GLORO